MRQKPPSARPPEKPVHQREQLCLPYWVSPRATHGQATSYPASPTIYLVWGSCATRTARPTLTKTNSKSTPRTAARFSTEPANTLDHAFGESTLHHTPTGNSGRPTTRSARKPNPANNSGHPTPGGANNPKAPVHCHQVTCAHPGPSQHAGAHCISPRHGWIPRQTNMVGRHYTGRLQFLAWINL
jgi:hypothetical protein